MNTVRSLGAIFVCALLWYKAQAGFDLVFEDATCEADPEYFEECTLYVDEDNDGTFLSVLLKICKTFPADLMVSSDIKQFYNGQYSLDLGFKIRENYCDVFGFENIFRTASVALGIKSDECPPGLGTYENDHFVLTSLGEVPDACPTDCKKKRIDENEAGFKEFFKTSHGLLLVILLGAGSVRGIIQGWGTQFGRAPLLERFFWNVMDFAYPDENSRQLAIMNGEFIPENSLPVGIEIWRNKLFVTIPRWREGIPATLNFISLDSNRGGSPKLTPYPNWAQNKAGDCGSGLTTAYRIHADVCDRLWVLDTGTIGIGDTTVQACPYTLNVFDLNTDKILRQYKLRPEDTNQNTFIANIAVDIGKGGCEDTYAYMSDELGYGLIVYSWQEKKSWRITHSFFMPDPLAGDYNIAGLNFQWGEEGIFGMSLSPIAVDGFRTLYFHPLSSNREFAVSTRILRDELASQNSYHEFQILPERGPLGHCTASVMDERGLQFFNLVDQNAVGCWNSLLPYAPINQAVVARHDEAMIFPADVKINRGLLWIISDRMPVFLLSNLTYTDVNFRILTVPVREAVAGTVCENMPWRYISNRIWWER